MCPLTEANNASATRIESCADLTAELELGAVRAFPYDCAHPLCGMGWDLGPLSNARLGAYEGDIRDAATTVSGSP